MRSEPAKMGTNRIHGRTLRGPRRELARKSMLKRIALEALEPRTLMAVLPAPTVLPNGLVNISGSRGNESTPSISISKNNPQKMAAVWVRNDPQQPTGSATIFVEMSVSNDGGQTWSPPQQPGSGQRLTDPTSTATPRALFAQITDASVAFDRNDQIYVLTSQHSADNNTGALLLNKFDFRGPAPTQPPQYARNGVIYQWIVDPALNPTLAVDDGVASFTDTNSAGQPFTQTDPFAGNVYVAWVSRDTSPIASPPNTFNPNRIRLVTSSDGGLTFSGIAQVNSGGNSGLTRLTDPKLAISQGRPAGTNGPTDPGVPGGQVTIVYDDFGSNSTGAAPFDTLLSNRALGGVAQTFAVNNGPNILDGVTGTPSHVPAVTNVPIPVILNDPRFLNLSDLDVALNLTHPTLAELSVELVPPVGSGLPTVTLFTNQTNAAGVANTNVGITGANLGITPSGIRLGTVFDDQSTRRIRDATPTAPFTGHFRPEIGSLSGAYAGRTAAQLNGIWTLRITDFRNSGTPVQSVNSVSLTFTSGLLPNPGDERAITTTTVRGALGGSFPTASPATPQGIGPGLVVASDNTLGAFSPYQGRLYASYVNRIRSANNPADNTDIYLSYSDDGGLSWSAHGLVNDDLAIRDGYSEGVNLGGFPQPQLGGVGTYYGRPQFMPNIAVDQANGALVLTWFDARDDASRSRVATYLTASIDGGDTFSSQVFANARQTATDVVTNRTVTLGPIPDNQSAGNPIRETTFGFGDHQGLAVFGGKVYPIWSSNLNGGTDTVGATDNARLLALDIRVARAQIAAGPRVVSSTMGPVGGPNDTLNNTRTADGTPIARSFIVTFDRPVDPSTFTPAQVQVSFRDTTTNGAGTPVPVVAVIPLTPSRFGATQFRVDFEPRGAVGTYSYSVGPNVRDRIRRPLQGPGSGNPMDQDSDGDPGEVNSDAYAIPSPQFFATSLQETLPLIVPGPHVVSSQVPGAPVSGDNLVLNAAVNAIDVTFDRDMDPNSFTPNRVLQIMGPAGAVAGPFTVTRPDPNSLRTYRIGFASQAISGTYSVSLGSNIVSMNGAIPLDTNRNAGVALLKGTPTDTTYTDTNNSSVQRPIADNRTVVSPLTIPDDFSVQGMTVTLNIAHQNDPDLSVTLIAPDGTSVLLFSGVGNVGPAGTRMNFSGTTLDDQAQTSIQAGAPPFFGRFRPQQPLGVLNGKNARGVWQLSITDNTANNLTGALNNWSLSFQKTTPASGLGEPVADQASVSFRVFTTSPTDPQSSTHWIPVGPTSISNGVKVNGYAGRVSSIAVDPSDPSGNTVFAAGASGGVWKSTNFLTAAAQGPTWIPLTDFAAVPGLNIGSIAVFGRNNDTRQSIIFAATGEANARYGATSNTARGIGFLRSMDGGSTWQLLDSTDNSAPFSARDHIFAAINPTLGPINGVTSAYKVVVDPRPTPTGEVIVYAALGGLNGGLWRSVNTGIRWERLSDRLTQTVATDVVLDLASATVDAVSNPTGNVDTIYVAFQSGGTQVYSSPNRGQILNVMTGSNFNPVVRDSALVPPPALPLTNTANPTGGGRVVLAKPDLQGWLYAAVADPVGNLAGLFMTKDNGQTWTRVRTRNIPTPAVAAATDQAIPTNDQTQADYDVLQSPGASRGNYNISLAVDPNDPNIVFLGGTSIAQQSGLIRIDVTRIYDPHAFVTFDSSRSDGGQVQPRTGGRIAVRTAANGLPVLTPPGSFPVGGNFLNLTRYPDALGTTGSTVFVFNAASFSNDGNGVRWIPFDDLLRANPNDLLPSTNVHQILLIRDPLTGRSRLIVGDDQGIFTGVDAGDGTLGQGVGTVGGVSYSRNGNLQIAQLFAGAAQPNNAATAGQIQALLYGNGLGIGAESSNPQVLNNGNIQGKGLTSSLVSDPLVGDRQGTNIATDQQGRGIVYQYSSPGSASGRGTEFFQISVNGGTFVSRTNGLNQAPRDPQWPEVYPTYPGGVVPGNFTVNPLNGDQVIISSNDGRIFGTTNQGVLWQVIGAPASLDTTYAPALTFGAPDPAAPGGVGNLNNFIYAGTVGNGGTIPGRIFVTRTGGGTAGVGNAWTNVSGGLDGSGVMKIITNPTRGSHEAFAVTLKGVYYIADSIASPSNPTPTWVNITGNLAQVFDGLSNNNPSLTFLNSGYLTSIQADWNYSIPNATGTGTHPVLYVSASAGVYRSLDAGATWSLFPAANDNTLPNNGSRRDGGYLPNAQVSDLDLVQGRIDPTTGRATPQQGDPNMLLATTFGRGQFVIRLSPIVFPNTVRPSTTLPAPGGSSSGTDAQGNPIVRTARPFFEGVSQKSDSGNIVRITIFDLTDPANPRIIGGFDGNPNGPTDIAANRTDAFGRFSIQVNPSSFASNGIKRIGLQATDLSGTKGNVQTIPINLQATNLGLPVPPTLVSLALDPADDSSNPARLPGQGQNITNVTTIDLIGMTDPGATLRLSGSATGNAVSDANGNYSITVGPLADGRYTFQVQASNAFGVGNSLQLTVTIDTQGPSLVPTLNILPDDDTGIKGDGVTASTRPRLVGVAEPGTLVEILDSNNLILIATTADANGNYSAQLPGFLSNGRIDLFVRSRDVARNVGPTSSPAFTLEIVSAAGLAPGYAPGSPVLQSGSDTGVVGDNITSVRSPIFDVAIGSVPAGLRLNLLRNGAVVNSVAAGGGGTLALNDPGPLADGQYVYSTNLSDDAGNVSPSSGPRVVTIAPDQSQAPNPNPDPNPNPNPDPNPDPNPNPNPDADPNPTPPPNPPVTVLGGRWQNRSLSRRRRARVLVVSFSGALDRGDAENVGGYRLVEFGRDRKFGTRDDRRKVLASATYDAATNTVTLSPRGRAFARSQQLSIFASLVSDSQGRQLDGDANGQPGGDFVGIVRRQGLSARVTAASFDALQARGNLPRGRDPAPGTGRGE